MHVLTQNDWFDETVVGHILGKVVGRECKQDTEIPVGGGEWWKEGTESNIDGTQECVKRWGEKYRLEPDYARPRN